jgi:hypothetical protein
MLRKELLYGVTAGILLAGSAVAQDVAPPTTMQEQPTTGMEEPMPPASGPTDPAPTDPMMTDPPPADPMMTDPPPSDPMMTDPVDPEMDPADPAMDPAPDPAPDPTLDPADPAADPAPPAMAPGSPTTTPGSGLQSEPLEITPSPGAGADGAAQMLRDEGFSNLTIKSSDDDLGMYEFRANSADGALVVVLIDVNNGRYWVHPGS